MQQTEKYKLNLIESSDPFLPDGLNQNTQKIEDVLAEKMEGPMVDLAQRVTALEAHKFYVGTYTGTGTETQVVALGFTPIAVFLYYSSKSERLCFVCTGAGRNDEMKIVEGGFQVGRLALSGLNDANHIYYFFAVK